MYERVLTKIRLVVITRMAKPEEVLIVEDENGESARLVLQHESKSEGKTRTGAHRGWWSHHGCSISGEDEIGESAWLVLQHESRSEREK